MQLIYANQHSDTWLYAMTGIFKVETIAREDEQSIWVYFHTKLATNTHACTVIVQDHHLSTDPAAGPTRGF